MFPERRGLLALAFSLVEADPGRELRAQVRNGEQAMQAGGIVLTEIDDGRDVDLAVGQFAIIDLFENAGGGYRWTIEQCDTTLLDLTEVLPRQVPSGPGSPVGSGGRARFEVRAKAAGTSTLILRLWRPWQGETSITQRFTLQVRTTP